MAAPVLIGTGPEVSVTGASPLSITFTGAHMPPGVQAGDRLVAIVHFASEFNVLAGYPAFPAGWSDDGVVGNGGTGYGTVAIGVFSTRWTTTTAPATFVWDDNLHLDHTLSGTLYAWRDSYRSSFSDNEAVERFDPTPPVWSPGSYAAPNSGFAMAAVAAQTAGTLTGISTANGFTAVAPTGRYTAAKAWDGPQTVTPPKWAVTPYGDGGRVGVAVWVAYAQADPPIDLPGGWRVGAIHMGGNQGW